MDPTFWNKRTELKLNELWDQNFSIRKRLEPVSKFEKVFFLYRFTDLERSQLGIRFDNPGVIAVIE